MSQESGYRLTSCVAPYKDIKKRQSYTTFGTARKQADSRRVKALQYSPLLARGALVRLLARAVLVICRLAC